jgi:hypothetical protein
MPKKSEEIPSTLVSVCDGCGRVTEQPAEESTELTSGPYYCEPCAERRADDPSVFVQGRTLTVSELRMQAEDDEHIAAALDGDTVQEAIKAARSKR